jgi:hypothetical protein
MLIEKLFETYPYIYHMAERETWGSIRERGLLSTSAVLNLFGLKGNARRKFESEHRLEMLSVLPGEPNQIRLRDQKPMAPGRLRQALIDGTTPEQWYQLINGKVFFWAERHRLIRLLNSYGDEEHDVLTIDTRSLVNAHLKKVWLCHMNSGNTWPIPHRRGIDIFQRIQDYPTKKNGKPLKTVVEVLVDHGVPDIAEHVVAVHRMKGESVLQEIWAKPRER